MRHKSVRDLGLQGPFQCLGLVVLITDLLLPARHPREKFSWEAAALIHRTKGGFSHNPLVPYTAHFIIDILLDLLDPLSHLLILLILGLPDELLSDDLHFLLN